MEICSCSGITLVGKFTNRITEIESKYASNKQSCEVIKMVNDYNYQKGLLMGMNPSGSIIAPLLKFERTGLKDVIERHTVSSCVSIN